MNFAQLVERPTESVTHDLTLFGAQTDWAHVAVAREGPRA
jgi:hypothetical protein